MTASRPPLPDSYEAILERARSALRAGSAEDAIVLYRRLVDRLGRLSERVLDLRPELSDLHVQAALELTEVLRVEGRYGEAMEVVEALLPTHPDRSGQLRRNLALLRIARGEVDDGLADLRALAEEEPHDVWNWIALGNEARVEGRLAESQDALVRAGAAAEAVGDSPDMSIIHYQRFLLLKEMGQLDNAVTAWEEGARLDEEMAASVRNVYTALTDAGRYNDALQYVSRDQNDLQAGFQRGLIASLTGKPAEAKRQWNAVANLDPDAFEYGHDAWVESTLRLGDPEPALVRLQGLLQRHGSPRLLTLAGIGWAMHGDRQLAQQLLERSIQVSRKARPPKLKIDSTDWRLLDSLVADDETKAALKPYFAVVETVWA